MANEIRFVETSDERMVGFKEVITVKLPATGTFYQGDQLVAEKLVSGSRSIYQGEEVTDATQETVMIINQNVYKDEYGNRHGLVANVGKITYNGGELVTCVRTSKNAIWEMTTDCIDGTPEAEKYLIPKVSVGDDRKLVVADSIGTANTDYKIETLSTIAKPSARAKSAIIRTVK